MTPAFLMASKPKETIMILQRPFLLCWGAALALGAMMPAASAAPWTRGYVVSTYGFAFHYGASSSAAPTDPGTDCAHGSAQHFSDEKHMRKALEQQPWRSELEIQNILKPPGIDQARLPTYVRFYIWGRAVSYRGWRKGIETYINPFAAPDPGQPQVTGLIGDGFDLDNNAATGGFVSRDGRRGIDNALYRAWGCDAPFRGPATATLDLRQNVQMQEGLYTVVIRLSGNKDPMNDDDVTVEIGYSPDKIVKDARGDVAHDYSYRIVKSEQYTKMKGRIKDGVVETEQVAALHVPRTGWFPRQMGDANFRQGRFSLKPEANGTVSGFVGGYRDWRELYIENTFAQTGAEQGIRDYEDAVALYYALQRNADGLPDPTTGQNFGISMAYRISAVPARVIDPVKPAQVRRAEEDGPRQKAFLNLRETVMRALTTRAVQEVPLGTGEAQFPAMERTIADLPSRDFFLKTFDAPAKLEDVDSRGNVKPQPEEKKPERQVNNAPPAALARQER